MFHQVRKRVVDINSTLDMISLLKIIGLPARASMHLVVYLPYLFVDLSEIDRLKLIGGLVIFGHSVIYNYIHIYSMYIPVFIILNVQYTQQ